MSDVTLVNDIFELCSLKMLDRFVGFSQLKDCALAEISPEKVVDDIDYRSEILLYGSSITARIQFFYNCNFLGSQLAHLYEDVKKEQVVDFFNEVGNLTGGKIKEVFLEQGIITALSLPMCTTTSKSKAVTTEEVLPHFKFFQVSHSGLNIFSAKISFELHDPDRFIKFDKNFSKSDFQDGDVDFF